MLKKRILASSMASVMALSSVSVVAFAEETKDYGEAVTKAELQEYVDSFEDFIADKLPDYGSKQGERFQAAIDHAKVVVEDEKAEAADYNAAYQMVKAVYNHLTIYTEAQLQALIKENQSKYDKNNEFNEEIGDLIYSEDSYATFTDAFEEATSYVDSGDSRLITDAYVALEDAVSKLSELKTVTKSDFRTALRAYEELEYKMKDYESWRRGKITVVPSTGTTKDKKKLLEVDMSYEQLIGLVYGGWGANKVNSKFMYEYWDNAWKTIDISKVSAEDEEKGHKGEGQLIGSYDADITGTTLKEFINDKYTYIDNIKGATITSAPDVVAAYEAAIDAVKVFDSWEFDTYKTGSKGVCSTLEQKYHNDLVWDFNTMDIDALKKNIEGTASGQLNYNITKDEDKFKVTIDTKNKVVKCNKGFAIIKDKVTGLMVGTTVYLNTTDAKLAITDSDTQQAVKVAANSNLLKILGYDTDFDEADAIAYHVDTATVGLADLDGSSDLKTPISSDNYEFDTTKAGFKAYAQVTTEATFEFKYLRVKSSVVDPTDRATAQGVVDKHNAVVDAAKLQYELLIHNPILKYRDEYMKNYEAYSALAATYASLISGGKITPDKTHTPVNTVIADESDAAPAPIKSYKVATGQNLSDTERDQMNDLNDAYSKVNTSYNWIVREQANIDGTATDIDGTSLVTAFAYYDAYKSFDFTEDSDKEEALELIQGLADGKTIAKAAGSPSEWTLIWRQLAYALEDKYPVTKTTKYTLSDLKALIDKAYVATEDTGDSSLFAALQEDLLAERQAAQNWYKKAKAYTGFKADDDKFYHATIDDDAKLADVYKSLKDSVDLLNNWLKDYKYSYEDIQGTIAEVAAAIDAGTVKGDALTKALAQCAYDLSVLEPTGVYDEDDDLNLAFDTSRYFQGPNRLKTAANKTAIKPNDYEKALLKSYEALVKAYDEAKKGEEKPSGVKGDVDGDGVVTFEDVNAVVAAFLAASTDKKFDVNGDGSVDFDDVNKAVELFLKA